MSLWKWVIAAVLSTAPQSLEWLYLFYLDFIV